MSRNVRYEAPVCPNKATPSLLEMWRHFRNRCCLVDLTHFTALVILQDMIAHFTENIYDIGIALSVSGGDPAPLVGHNAFLRSVGIH